MPLKEELSVSKTIFMLHSALNPILYGLFTLRKEHVSALFSSFRETSRLSRTNTRESKILKEANGYKITPGVSFSQEKDLQGVQV